MKEDFFWTSMTLRCSGEGLRKAYRGLTLAHSIVLQHFLNRRQDTAKHANPLREPYCIPIILAFPPANNECFMKSM